jgi:hypothetical protein
MNWGPKEWYNQWNKKLVLWKNKQDKPLAKLTKGRKEKAQIYKIGGAKETTDTSEIQKIIWEYFENLYSSKLENQEEVDKFLSTYDLPKLNQKDINNFNRSITSNKIETVKNLSAKKSPGPDGFTAEFYQTLEN